MDSFDHIGAAGTLDVRLSPAGPGPAREAASAEGLARAERRAARLAALERGHEATCQAIERVNDYIHGRLLDEEAKPFERIADPGVTLTKLDRALRQIVALEERLDESDEEHAKRRAAEAEAHAKAKRLEEERLKRTPEDSLRDQKKKAVRHAMRNLLRDANPDLHREDRERLLDDLFSDYENYDEDYAGDPARIVLELCREAGIDPEPDGEDASWGDENDPVARAEARALAVIWRYLAAVAPDLCPPVDEDEPASRGRGPP